MMQRNARATATGIDFSWQTVGHMSDGVYSARATHDGSQKATARSDCARDVHHGANPACGLLWSGAGAALEMLCMTVNTALEIRYRASHPNAAPNGFRLKAPHVLEMIVPGEWMGAGQHVWGHGTRGCRDSGSTVCRHISRCSAVNSKDWRGSGRSGVRGGRGGSRTH